jgi:hypothetical protein
MIKIQTFDLGAIFCMILSRVMAAVFADPLRDKKKSEYDNNWKFYVRSEAVYFSVVHSDAY